MPAYDFSDDMRDPTPILETNDDGNLWYHPETLHAEAGLS